MTDAHADTEVARLERLARLSVAILQGDWDAVTAERQSAPPGEPDREWREAVLQTYLFGGFPRVVEAFRVLKQAGGLGTPGPEESDGPEFHAGENRAARGRALFDRIYAEQADAVRSMLETNHTDFARWIEEHAYGRVLARDGLSPARRECLAVVCLAALGQERQLAAHLRGGVRCGATPELLRRALQAVEGQIGTARLHAALTVADTYAPASQ